VILGFCVKEISELPSEVPSLIKVLQTSLGLVEAEPRGESADQSADKSADLRPGEAAGSKTADNNFLENLIGLQLQLSYF
jgi:hypothetical protein